MSLTCIKSKLALVMAFAAIVFHAESAQARGFGRFVVGQVLNNSPRAQMIAGTIVPIVQTAQFQGGRLSPGQIVQAVSDGRNLVQNLRVTSGPSVGVPMSMPMEMPVMQQASSFPGMATQEIPASYSEPMPQGPTPQQGPGPGPQGPMGMAPVDLLVEDISLASPATKVAGPSYKITVRNQGSETSAKFHIGLFASLDGKVNDQVPKAFLEVRDLAPNTSGEYTIRLPKVADKMLDPESKETKPFKHIAVAVDFFGVQPEADESNNTAMLLRSEVEGAEQSAE
jgi:hypothetical protein